jgi:chromosome segregation ATPase
VYHHIIHEHDASVTSRLDSIITRLDALTSQETQQTMKIEDFKAQVQAANDKLAAEITEFTTVEQGTEALIVGLNARIEALAAEIAAGGTVNGEALVASLNALADANRADLDKLKAAVVAGTPAA